MRLADSREGKSFGKRGICREAQVSSQFTRCQSPLYSSYHMESVPKELECPITMELLADPVSVPCCGRSFSRAALANWLSSASRCPMCNGNLSACNPSLLPKNVVISYMIEEYVKKNAPVAHDSQQAVQDAPYKPEDAQWSVKLHKLTDYGRTVIGCMDISLSPNRPSPQNAVQEGAGSSASPSAPSSTSSDSPFKTLIIPVVDESGSMYGNPTEQVRYSLARIVDLVFDHPHLLAHVVCYSDGATSFKIDKDLPKANIMAQVNAVGNGGGTSFKSAFRGILDVCKQYTDNPEVASIAILFLTDGEDSNVPAHERQSLVDQFKLDLKEKVSLPSELVPLSLHSIGFGASHDYNFLNSLRMIGSHEGAYRYADPSENKDSLAQKIGSLFYAIAAKPAIPVRFDSISMANAKLLYADGARIWFDMTHAVHTLAPKISFFVKDEHFTEQAEFAEEENEPEIRDAWYSHLTDQLSAELMALNAKKDDDESSAALRPLHFELILRRANALKSRLSFENPTSERLSKIIETAKAIQAGQAADEKKLNDMKFEGKYGGGNAAVTGSPMASSSAAPTSSIVAPKAFVQNAWKIITKNSVACNLRPKDTSHLILKSLGCDKNDALKTKLTEMGNDVLTFEDENGNSLLHLASRIGRLTAVQHILSLNPPSDYLNKRCGSSSSGPTAADIAILFGYWKTFDLLASSSHALEISLQKDTLLRSCLSSGYFKTAKAFRVHSKIKIDSDLVDHAPNAEIANWLAANSGAKVSLSTAIKKGMVETVEELIKDTEALKSDGSLPFSFSQYYSILDKPTDDHMQIMDILFDAKLAFADETFTLPKDDAGDEEEEISWPLFAAAQNGNHQLFNLILARNDSKEHINRQNKKGTTALWIASCNRHVDILYALLERGADPNLCNHKGDGPLIPACQKGSQNIVEALLNSGASLESYNKNRDNPVLICCRTGQSKILKILLEHVSAEKRVALLKESAEIDGFDPLHASAELDKVECIRVCVEMGADISARTALNNPIIAGATALHLAAFYGRTASLQALIDLGSDPTEATSSTSESSPADSSSASSSNAVASNTTPNSTALHLAVKQGHAAVVRLLLSIPSVKASANATLDGAGHIASYYAQTEANAELYAEFFENRLASALRNILFAQTSPSSAAKAASTSKIAPQISNAPQADSLELRTLQLLEKHAQAPGVYSYAEFLSDASMGNDAPLLTSALLTGRFAFAEGLLKTLGADAKRPDAYGISPEFWAHYLGFYSARAASSSPSQIEGGSSQVASDSAPISAASSSSSGTQVPAYIQVMLDRVEKVSKQSLQNKQLLAAPRLGQNSAPKLLASGASELASSPFDIVLKMRDGFNASIRPRAVQELKGYATKKHLLDESLIGFADKLKSSRKLFPEGEDTLEALLWEAKIHLIRAVATTNPTEDPVLSPVSYLALFLYTSHPDIFTKVNMTLSNWQNSNSQGESKNEQQIGAMWKQFVQCLYRSLTLLPNFSGELYRTVPGAFNPKEYTIGSKISWDAFSVTTRDWNNLTTWMNESPKSDPKTKRGVIFIIQSKTAKRIEKFSRFPIEGEAIVLPGTQFVVKNLFIASIIAFGQANIRNSTYLAKENDLAKATAGDTSIVVELEEVVSEDASSSPKISDADA